MLKGTPRSIRLDLRNVGCLEHVEVELKPGLNVIRAPNASGKTSFVRGLVSMFSNRVPPEHVLKLGSSFGWVKVRYGVETYERRFRRTPSGSVIASGRMLPFADHRAFDCCVALPEAGIVHKVIGGASGFREYLEGLSYGRYYAEIVSTAQELVNELSLELSGPEFEKFESLPSLITEYTNLCIERDEVKGKIEDLRARYESERGTSPAKRIGRYN